MKNIIRLFIILTILSVTTGLWAQNFSSRKTFKAGISAFKDRNYYSARLLFQEILHKDPLGDYGDDSRYFMALTYYYGGNYNTALFEFNVLLRDFPNSSYVAGARFWIGESYYFMNRYSEALENHYNFISTYPDHQRTPYAYYTRGYIYMQQKRYEEAIQEFSTALDKFKDSPVSVNLAVQKGIAYYNLKAYGKAREIFVDIKNSYGSSNMVDDAQFWIAKTYFASGMIDEAEQGFRDVVEKFPDTPLTAESIYFIALCRYQQNDDEGALKNLNEIIASYPTWEKISSAFFRRGQVYHRMKQYDSAGLSFLAVIKDYPESEFYIAALESLADVWKNAGKTDEAIAVYNRVIDSKKTPANALPVVLQKKGSLLFTKGDYQKASETFQQVYRKYPADDKAPEAMFMQAQSYFKTRLFERSLDRLNILIKKYPGSDYKVDAYFLKGEIYFALTRYKDSLVNYQKIIRFYKKHHRYYGAYMGIGWSYFELKQYARAADIFKTVMKTFSEKEKKIEAKMAWASCLFNLRDFDGALRAYTEIIKDADGKGKWAEEATFQMAWVEYRRQKYKEATVLFADYQKKYPEGNRAIEAGYFLGWSRYRQGLYNQALFDFKTAWEQAPDTSPIKEKALLDYAKTYVPLKQPEKVIENLDLFIEKYPESKFIEDALYTRAINQLKLENMEGARDSYEKLKKAVPESAYLAEILRSIGDYYRKKGEYEKADEIYVTMKKSALNPDEKWEAHFSLAQLKTDQKQYPTARRLYTEVLDSRESDAGVYRSQAVLQLAALMFLQKNYYRGLQDIKKYRPGFKKEKSTYNELGIWQARFHLQREEYDDAIAQLRTLLSDRELGLIARFYTGEAWYKKDNPAMAYDFFKQVSQKSEDALAPRAMKYMGDIHYQKKEYDEAARSYTKLVYLYSQDPQLFEEALYKSALTFKQLERKTEYETYYNKLIEAFPESGYIKELPEPGEIGKKDDNTTEELEETENLPDSNKDKPGDDTRDSLLEEDTSNSDTENQATEE